MMKLCIGERHDYIPPDALDIIEETVLNLPTTLNISLADVEASKALVDLSNEYLLVAC
jgi:hypothetical protein